jgi:hypothetical protein
MRSQQLKEFKIVVRNDGSIELKDYNIAVQKIKLDKLKRRTIETLIDMLREGRLVRGREYETLGVNLYSVLLDNDIGKELIDQVNEQTPRKALRVNLEFETSEGGIAYGLECWPWEYLRYEPGQGRLGRRYYLATTTRLTLTRSLWLQGLLSDTVLDNPPLKVLFVVARPSNLDEFDPEKTKKAIDKFKIDVAASLAERFPEDKIEDLVEFDELIDPQPALAIDRSPQYEPQATWEKFCGKVFNMGKKLSDSRRGPNVIHFLGHGSYEDDTGRIAFTHRNGEAHWIDDEMMAETLDVVRAELKLVFLQACESGSLPRHKYDPYRGVTGVGLCLAKCDIPAVVAMQYDIKPRDADTFANAFYGALADNEPIDVAVQIGRARIAASRQSSNVASRGEAFGLPVLYSRKPGTLIPEKRARQPHGGYNPATAPVAPGPISNADPQSTNAASAP